MEAALAESKLSIQQGTGPTGCVIVKDNQIIASGHNEQHTQCDPTAHAEMVTIKRLCQAIQHTDLKGYTLYSTLQPCGMCSAACIWANLSTIVYGAGRGDVSERLFDEKHLNLADYVKDSFHPEITIISGVLKEECRKLYE